jgi:hypothetical protein
MDLSGAPVDTSQKAYWGPRLWVLFHSLAEISDRRDMVMLWNNLMRLTAAAMPCEQCRTHLSAYMRTHVFVRFPKIHLVTGEMVRARATAELYALHNDVNARLEKPIFTVEELAAAYRKPRAEVLSTIHRVYDEVKVAWTPLVHSRINGSAFNEWKKHVNMMIALASGGPN